MKPPLKRPLATWSNSDARGDALDRRLQHRRAAGAAVGAEVHGRQRAVEQPRDHRADRVAVVEDHGRMRLAQAGQLGGDGGVVGLEIGCAPGRDLGRIRCLTPQGLAVERRGRAQLGRGLARIEGHARRVAIHVDDRARDRGAHDGGVEVGGKVVEPVDPPVGVLAGKPWRDQPAFVLGRDGRCRYAAG